MSGLAEHLGGEQRSEALAEALAAAKAIRDKHARAEALSELAEHLGGEQRSEALAEALSAAKAIGDEYYRAEAVSELVTHLSDEHLADAFVGWVTTRIPRTRLLSQFGAFHKIIANDPVGVLAAITDTRDWYA